MLVQGIKKMDRMKGGRDGDRDRDPKDVSNKPYNIWMKNVPG